MEITKGCGFHALAKPPHLPVGDRFATRVQQSIRTNALVRLHPLRKPVTELIHA
jgi:hypothetical protein